MLITLPRSSIINLQKSIPLADSITSLHKGLYIDLQKSITRSQATAVHKELPPGGDWRTINGHHIYVKDGVVLAGSLPGVTDGKAKKATKTQLKEHQKTVDKEAYIPTETIKNLLTHADKADFKGVWGTLSNLDNKKSAKAFEDHTGVKLPKALKARLPLLKQMFKEFPAEDPQAIAYLAKTAKQSDNGNAKQLATNAKIKAGIEDILATSNNNKPKAKVDAVKEMAKRRAEVDKMLDKKPAKVKLIVKPKPSKPKATAKAKPVDKVADIRHDAQKNRQVAYDVGAKIGLAKKDREIYQSKFSADPSLANLADLEKADPAWAMSIVGKDTLLPKASAEWLAGEEATGSSYPCAWMKSYLYGRIAKKPLVETAEGRKNYVAGCNYLRDLFDQIKTKDDMVKTVKELGVWGYFGDKKDERIKRLKELNKNATSNLKLNDADIVKTSGLGVNNYWTVEKLAKLVREDRIPKAITKRKAEIASLQKTPLGITDKLSALGPDFLKAVLTTDGLNKMSNSLATKPENWEAFHGKKSGSSEEAKGKREPYVVVKWERQKPSVITRTGGTATKVKKPEDMVKDFGFRGVEFGNWVDDHSGKFHLTKCAEALNDLADVIGVNHKQISFNGRLAVAFGARGKSKALAHYEPDLKVINLTKENGTGSMAHEWCHALDHAVQTVGVGHDTLHYASEQNGDLSGHPELQKQYKNLMRTLTEGDMKGVKPFHMEDQLKKNRYRVSEMTKGLYNSYNGDIDKALAHQAENYTKYLQSYSSYTSPGYAEAYRARAKRKYQNQLKDLAGALATHHKEVTGKDTGYVLMPTFNSQFYEDSAYVGHGKPYWTSPVEMFARAGESYVQDKLQEQGRNNDYLVSGTKGKVAEKDTNFRTPYPQGDERHKINMAFQSLVDSLHLTGMLKKALMFDLQKSLECYARNAYNVANGEGVIYIPLNRIKSPYQTEQATDFDKVYENARKMRAGENLDPVTIGYDYDLHDGHHRLEASRIMGYTHIPCVVGGNNELEVQRANEAYKEVWKSFYLKVDKENMVLIKSLGGFYDLSASVWTVTVDFTSEDFKTLVKLSKSLNVEIKEL